MDFIPTPQDIDTNYIWHPYDSLPPKIPNLLVKRVKGSTIFLEDGRVLIDGLSSWWSAIHGYNQNELNNAIKEQLRDLPHVMFGGLTHKSAIGLTTLLLEILPKNLKKIFFCDSGSVAIEVALKIAIQYWHSKKDFKRTSFMSLLNGYHGDTFGAMSLCDPINGMHSIFKPFLMKTIFAPAPNLGFFNDSDTSDIDSFEELIKKYHSKLAGVILEPIVQGAGGMRIYRPSYLKRVRELCSYYNVLLIVDEIATGFCHTGTMFAFEHAKILPDIMCVGKGLSAGYISLAATICRDDIANEISSSDVGMLLHGPTFMGNALACAVAKKSVSMLLNSSWRQNVINIENAFKDYFKDLINLKIVNDVRIIGAIGVIELKNIKITKSVEVKCIENGVWIRSIRNIIYSIPSYNITNLELEQLCSAISLSVKEVDMSA